jgi:hypothetical protein
MMRRKLLASLRLEQEQSDCYKWHDDLAAWTVVSLAQNRSEATAISGMTISQRETVAPLLF